MDICQTRQLKLSAREALAQATDSPKKLFFLFCAVSLGINLLSALLNLLLTNAFSPASGLAGMQARAILTTGQTLLQMVASFALPFWQFGLVYISLLLIRRERSTPGSLLEGFRRFVPALGLMLLRGLLLFAVSLGCSFLSSFLFLQTPASADFVEQATALLSSAVETQATLTPDMLMPLMPSMTGFFVIFLIVFCGIYIPLSYRLRMADYLVMDRPGTQAFTALIQSFRMMKGNCLSLLRLDLSFWWYYGLSGIILLIYSLDVLLAQLGIPLPVSADIAFWLCYGLYLVLQLLLMTCLAPSVQVAYAAAYQSLAEPEPE